MRSGMGTGVRLQSSQRSGEKHSGVDRSKQLSTKLNIDPRHMKSSSSSSSRFLRMESKVRELGVETGEDVQSEDDIKRLQSVESLRVTREATDINYRGSSKRKGRRRYLIPADRGRGKILTKDSTEGNASLWNNHQVRIHF